MSSVLGCDIRLRQAGQGPPAVLLHGNPDSSLLWQATMDAMAPRFHCIAPDLPGYGLSTAPADFDYSLDGQADFVDALMRTLGIHEPVNLVGHDFGGIFCMAWMSRHPRKVRRLALSNTAFFADYAWHFWARLWRRPGFGELSMALMNRPAFGLVYRRGSPAVPSRYVRAAYELVTPDVKRNILRLYRAVRPASFEGWEARYFQAAQTVPVQVLWGDGDPYIPDRFAERFHARRVVHVPRAGHWLPAVAPQAVARHLIEYFGA
jgi:haloalkane dehalogenase